MSYYDEISTCFCNAITLGFLNLIARNNDLKNTCNLPVICFMVGLQCIKDKADPIVIVCHLPLVA